MSTIDTWHVAVWYSLMLISWNNVIIAVLFGDEYDIIHSSYDMAS